MIKFRFFHLYLNIASKVKPVHTIQSLGILGGTFDPIHFGHLVAAEFVRDACRLDRVIFMPSARPPHKDLDQVLDSHHRYNMVELAVGDNDDFMISAMELERQGLSYTVETITNLRQIYPEAQIYFILGIDALLLINTWKDVDRLVKLCRFIVVTRPGYLLNRDQECFKGLPAALWENMTVLSIPGLSISSSEIRQRVSEGKTIRYLVPALVEKYIRENNLYQGGE